MKFLMASVFSVALLTAPLLAKDSSKSEEEQAEAKPAKKKKICRTYSVTGSLVRKARICRTDEEWKAADAAASKSMADMQRTASGAASCIGLNCDGVPGQ